MRINFARRALITRLTALVLLALCLTQLPAGAQGAQAQTQQTRQVTIIQDMAPVGLTFGQTLRYTWANLSDPDPQKREFEPSSIRVRLLAADGSVIAQKEAAAVPVGQSQSFDFNRDQINVPDGSPGTGRLQARLEATVSGPMWSWIVRINPGVIETFDVAVEVINNSSGRTTVIKGGGANGIILNDSPGKEFVNPKSYQIISAGNDGIYGIIPGQSLLVHALNITDPQSREQAEPVNVQVKAYDKAGNVIAESDAVQIPPRQFRTIRFKYGDLLTASEPDTGRKQVRTLVDRTHLSAATQPILPPGKDLVISNLVSFEIVDDNTGGTVVLTGHQCLVFFLGGMPSN
jgi:hypothetical protein